jgi:hypothetical protein
MSENEEYVTLAVEYHDGNNRYGGTISVLVKPSETLIKLYEGNRRQAAVHVLPEILPPEIYNRMTGVT